MPTFSQSLEQSLHRALAIANERHHQYATLEHLVLSLIDDSDAAAVMRACSVDLDKLRTSLVNYLETEFENLVTDGADDAKPTAGFQRGNRQPGISPREPDRFRVDDPVAVGGVEDGAIAVRRDLHGVAVDGGDA